MALNRTETAYWVIPNDSASSSCIWLWSSSSNVSNFLSSNFFGCPERGLSSTLKTSEALSKFMVTLLQLINHVRNGFDVSRMEIWSEIGAQKNILTSTTRRPTSRPLQWQNYELGYELIPHLPYYLDLAPCDFFLFPNLKTWLGGKKFSSNEKVIVAINEYFADFETAYFKWLLNVNYASFLAEIWPEEFRRVDLSRCRVIKWIVASFHGNLPNLSNDPRIYILHGLKSLGIFNKNKRFLGKVIFIPQHSCLRGTIHLA